MNVAAIMGSPRKGKATDRLTTAALDGVLSFHPQARVSVINLVERDIRHCLNCLTCRDNPAVPYAPCAIKDGMEAIYPVLDASDALILASPAHMGQVTALMLSFWERVCWTFAKPTRRILTIGGIPEPRTPKKRVAAIIVVSGVAPPWARWLADDATPFLRAVARDSLNCRAVGGLYAGAVEHRGVDAYVAKARALGGRLARAAMEL
jgi:hypothetical protein